MSRQDAEPAAGRSGAEGLIEDVGCSWVASEVRSAPEAAMAIR